MATERMERLVTGVEEFDNYIDYMCSVIDAARNVTASAPIQARITPFGLQLAGTAGGLILAKSKSGGIAALSGTAPGKADVTLWDYDGMNIATQTVDVEAVNLASTAVGGSKMLLLAPLGKWKVVIWEECS